MNMFNDVREFAEKMKFMVGDEPRHLTTRKLMERQALLDEEVGELRDAIDQQDLVEIADALVDIVYVALGTAVALGLPWEELWDDVHRANMAKRAGITPRGPDALKPMGWRGPMTKEILLGAGYDRRKYLGAAGDMTMDLCHDDLPTGGTKIT